MRPTLSAALMLIATICSTPASAAATTIQKGTMLQTRLGKSINTATLKPGDSVVFVVVAPYPQGAALRGATIVANVTDVTHASGDKRARIGFLFDHIALRNGTSEPIAAYVNSSAVVRRGGASQTSSYIAQQLGTTQSSVGQANGSSTIFWQHKIGKTAPSTNVQTGGYAYARKSGDIALPAGTPVTLELARGLAVP